MVGARRRHDGLQRLPKGARRILVGQRSQMLFLDGRHHRISAMPRRRRGWQCPSVLLVAEFEQDGNLIPRRDASDRLERVAQVAHDVAASKALKPPPREKPIVNHTARRRVARRPVRVRKGAARGRRNQLLLNQ
eukprot:4262953-Pyramimonas_sp.AAC.1